MELGDDDAFCTVDDEGALWGHQRDFSHVDLFFFGGALLFELEGNMERGAKGQAFTHRLADIQFGFTDVVAGKVEGDGFVVTLDGEDLFKHGLEARHFPLSGADILLKKIDIAIELDFDEVGRFSAFPEFAKIFAFRHGSNCSKCWWLLDALTSVDQPTKRA